MGWPTHSGIVDRKATDAHKENNRVNIPHYKPETPALKDAINRVLAPMPPPKAAHFTPAAELFRDWAADVLTGKPPELWRVGAGFHPVELGPGLVCLVGGAPGAGKTAVTMQWIVDALRLDSSLRCLVCNVEMAPRTLLDRQLARLSGLDANWIRFRTLAGHEHRARAGLDVLASVAPRLAFHTGPATLLDVARSVDAFGARLLVLDYIQRFGLGAGDAQQDRRSELDGVMGHVRKFADAGMGVLVVSAVSRQKGKTGSNYVGLGLASFRGSSELEYGADSCWTLAPEDDADKHSPVRLDCAKNRHGNTPSLLLNFDRMRQSFTPVDGAAACAPVRVPASTPAPSAQSQTPDVFDLGEKGYAEDEIPFD
jgi:replicative DNA helicase